MPGFSDGANHRNAVGRSAVDVYAYRGMPVKASPHQHRRDLLLGLNLVQTGKLDRADFGQPGRSVVRNANVKHRVAVAIESGSQRYLQDIAGADQVALVLRGSKRAQVNLGRIPKNRGLKRLRQLRRLVNPGRRTPPSREQQHQRSNQAG